MSQLHIISYAVIGWLVAVAGCSRVAKIEIPVFNPSATAKAMTSALDKDANGSVSMEEAKGSPGLHATFGRYDADGNKSLSLEEISAKFDRLLHSGVGILSVGGTVAYKGKPLAGATVKLVPEEFFGGALQPAEGVTDATGYFNPVTANDVGIDGMQFGIYKVEVTHPQINIPAAYNTATTIGCEISPTDRGGDTIEFDLK